MSKRILFLLRQAPYGSSHALEALDSVLVAGVFEQDVSVLFKDDGVWQIVSDQDGARLGTRTVAKVALALPEYDVTHLYVCGHSLTERGLAVDDLLLPVTLLSHDAQQELISRQHAVIND